MFVILGPTSSGKSDYAIRLAREVGGEIVSVDSRQVYRGMDIGTGKIPRDSSGNSKSQIPNTKQRNKDLFFSEGIRHHLLDIASPKREYNVTHFLRDARKAIADIEKRGKTPILVGGTTFWAEALLLGTSFPEVKPDKKLRARLEKFSAEKLFETLKERDPERAETIDRHNKIRLIRALEIIETLGKVPPLSVNNQQTTVNRKASPFFHSELVSGSLHHLVIPSPVIPSGDEGSSLQSTDSSPLCHSREGGNPAPPSWIPGQAWDDMKIIILSPPKEILHSRIEKRLKERLGQGMIEEVKHLHDEGVSWKRLEGFGLEYRWCARYLQGKISREDMEAELLKDSKHYAKRQLTFLRRLERCGLRTEWVTKVSA